MANSKQYSVSVVVLLSVEANERTEAIAVAREWLAYAVSKTSLPENIGTVAVLNLSERRVKDMPGANATEVEQTPDSQAE
jgi:hypothetical protein